jgi:hypothetical protein
MLVLSSVFCSPFVDMGLVTLLNKKPSTRQSSRPEEDLFISSTGMLHSISRVACERLLFKSS